LTVQIANHAPNQGKGGLIPGKGLHHDKDRPESKGKRLVIVGLPNTGKSQVFNNLTGAHTLVANYPMTTVEVARARCRINEEDWEVIDTPGLHSLYVQSEEELAVRNILFEEPPDVILQCIDANQLKQSLNLTADLLELGLPLVISLNLIDQTTRSGIWTDSDMLRHKVGVPVIESIAVDSIGTKQLKSSIGQARAIKKVIRYGDQLEKTIGLLASILKERVPYPRETAILHLLKDPFINDSIRDLLDDETLDRFKEKTVSLKRQLDGELARVFLSRRSHWVDEVADKATRKQKVARGRLSEVLARISRHPVFGLPILAFFIIATYFLVVNVAGAIADAMNEFIVVPSVEMVEVLLPAGLWRDLIVGEHGLLTLGFFNAICTVLPILSVFFLMLGLMEDIGYLPNMSIMTSRLFEKIGLSGKAIMPLVLGFGCKTMATLTTKSLTSRKERYIAIYLIAFAIPCAAQMGPGIAILGRMGFMAFVIAFSTLFIVEILAGFTLNKIIKEERRTDFIQELPDMRLPNLTALVIKTYYRLLWFLKEALPIFIIAALGLFIMDITHLLGLTKDFLRPVITGWLGLPLDIVDPLILCMARREAAAGMLLGMVEQGTLNLVQTIVAVVLTTLFVPCFNNVVAMIKELGLKAGLLQVFAINFSAFFIGGFLNWVLISTI
jgi:ferrous iron transport protein B